MQLSTYQRTILERLRRMHVGGATWAFLLGRFRNQWLLAVVWTALMWWFLPESLPLFVGVTAGMVWRDTEYVRSLRDQWPVMNEVIDWQRVDDVLASNLRSEEPTK